MATRPSTTTSDDGTIGEQLLLFDAGIDLAAIRAAREKVLGFAQARNTVRTYRSSWLVFHRWCAAAGAADFARLGGHRLSLCDLGLRPTQVNVCAAHLLCDYGSPSPGASAEPGNGSGQGSARGPGSFRRAGIRREARPHSSATPHRDRFTRQGFPAGVSRSSDFAGWLRNGLALGGTGRSAFARGDAVAFVYAALSAALETDQLGKGREVKVPRVPGSPLCPVAALEGWIKARGPAPGALFLPFRGANRYPEHRAIQPDTVCHVVKRCLHRAGVDPRRYGAHSLRAGMVTAATENGADLISISERTGHKGLDTLAGYVRSHGGFNRDPLEGVL